MSYPEDLKYTQDHEWVRIEGDVMTLGLTHYAQDQLGDIVYVELPSVGDEIVAKESFGVVESTKSVSDVYSPLSGSVTESNEPVIDAPEMLNQDPYGEGWLIKIKFSGEADDLMNAADYQKFISEGA